MLALTLLFCAVQAQAGTLAHRRLERELVKIARHFDGRVGICAADGHGVSCVDGNHAFSLQSVMKLLVAMAVMDGVDKGRWRLEDGMHVERKDLSVYVQPMAKLVGDKGYDTTLGDLVRRAIIDSDSAAADILVRKLGGPGRVQDFLKRHGIRGIRVDRDEQHLQSEIVGLKWKQDYSDPAAFEQAVKQVPDDQRTAAYRYYQADIRDTATPHAMVLLLRKFAAGRLLSADSTKYLLGVMGETGTGPDRLKAGLPAGWEIMHKTGTSGSWQGVTAATNDVGIVKAPDGGTVAIAVFVADSRASDKARAAVIAKIAAATAANYRPSAAR